MKVEFNEPLNDYEVERGTQLVLSYWQIREHRKPTELTNRSGIRLDASAPPGIGSKLSFCKCSSLYPGCNRDCRQTKRANVGSGQPKNTHPFKGEITWTLLS